jgi:hypothetical protein
MHRKKFGLRGLWKKLIIAGREDGLVAFSILLFLKLVPEPQQTWFNR